MKHIEEWIKQTQPGEKIVVIGAGSLGKLTIDCILRNGNYLRTNIAILDDNPEVQGKKVFNVPVIGSIEIIERLKTEKDICFVIAIANNKIRKKIVTKFPNLRYSSVISKESVISPFAKVGKGCVILPGAVIDPDVIIKDHVIVNKVSTIGHDTILCSFSQVSPGVKLGGYVELGECSFIGLGAVVLPFKKITDNVVIGAGAVVTRDIKITESVFVGNPARILKKESV